MQNIVPLHGFGGVPYSAVRRAAPRNLLDNSDFTNLVAQADIGGSHGTTPYAADRWILDSGTVSYEAGVGLTLNGTIRQKLEFPPTGDTSAFVGTASGEASIVYADGEITITSSGGVLKWAALYAGTYSAATMPEYQPKGYGAELAECMRYFRIVRNENGYVSSSNAYIFIQGNMRVMPTATVIISGSIRANGKDVVVDSVSSVQRFLPDSIRLTMPGTFSASNHSACLFNATIHLSADL